MNDEPSIKDIFKTTKMHDIKAPIIYSINLQAVFSSEGFMKAGFCVSL